MNLKTLGLPCPMRLYALAVLLLAPIHLAWAQLGTIVPGPTMRDARGAHTATFLRNNRVLVAAGGIGSAEVFQPNIQRSGRFEVVGGLASERFKATATLLSDGRVLIVGGNAGLGGSTPLSTAEIYDPKSQAFVPTGSLATARLLHTATLLNNGKVLIVGGNDGNEVSLASAELFDPGTGQFTTTGSLASPRTDHRATLLENGKVLITGGCDCFAPRNKTIYDTAELYDPTSGTFNTTGTMTTPRYAHAATLLSDGRVMLTGGWAVNTESEQSVTTSVEVFDPTTGLFHPAGNLNSTRINHQATLLANDDVLISGGHNEGADPRADTEVYDPPSSMVTAGPTMSVPRAYHTATLLRDGRVLLVGGSTGFFWTPTNTTDIYCVAGHPCSRETP